MSHPGVVIDHRQHFTGARTLWCFAVANDNGGAIGLAWGIKERRYDSPGRISGHS